MIFKMPRKVGTHVTSPSNDKVCCFCGLGDDDELQYGKFHKYNGILTHYYCLLLSSNMQQKGRDDEGILGFLPEDINKELKRGKRLVCCYCKKTGATLGCCNTKCKKIFHFPCGLKSGSLHQFFGEFRSYCRNHRPRQKIDDRVSEEVKKRDDMICYICYDDVSPNDMYGTLWAPCCKKNAWFHRTCVQQLAMSAGYFFKCPLCNNKAEFQRAMLDQGIFIPSQDASWELVPNAFHELLYRHSRCDADDCLCPKGREHTSSNAKWELTLCRTCGSQGIHMACGNLKWVKPIWECTECTSILKKTLASDSETTSSVMVRVNRQRITSREDENSMDDDSSDSDISVGTEIIEPSTLVASHADNEPPPPPDSPPALRITRRSVIPITKSPVNTKTNLTSKTAAATGNELLPPERKKPRYSEHVIQRNRRGSIDSDDDIVVISGPSTSENLPPNGRKTPLRRLTDNSRLKKTNGHIEYPSVKNELEEPKSCEKTAYISLDKFKLPQAAPTIRAVPMDVNEGKRVVEIDLSETEYTIPESRANPLVNDNTPAPPPSTANSLANPPEFNFMITNVTSLPPEAFDNEEQQKVEFKEESMNVQSRTSIFNESNGGLTAQTPIVLDDEPLPSVAPSNNVPVNNNLYFPSMEIHDQMKLIRFDSPLDADGKPTNTVLYGITIPGTNQTVPLIFAPAENINFNSTSETSNVLNPRNVNQPGNNGSNFISGSNGLTSLENHQKPCTAPIRSNENPIASKYETSSLSPSVPLKSIVNERFATSRSHRKSHDKNGNKTIVASNQSSLEQSFGIPFSTKNSDVQVQPIAAKNPISKVQPIAAKNPISKVQPNAAKNPISKVQPIAAKNPISKVQPIAPKKPIATATSPAVQVQTLIKNGSLVKMSGAPIFPKATIQQTITTISNCDSLTRTLKQAVSNGQATKKLSNNIDVATISKMFALLPPDPSSTAAANPSPFPNIIISTTTTTTTTTTMTTTSFKQNNQTTPTINAILPDVNTTWLHSSGSIIKINSDTANTANIGLSTQMEIQKSAGIEQQQIIPQLYQLIRTDSDNHSNDDCDGAAGSDPADQPAYLDTSRSTETRHVTPRHSERDQQLLQVGKENTHDRRTSIAECNVDTVNETERSASSDRSDASDPIGLIYKTINLRDLKFSVCGSNIIKMALYDTYTVNIKVDSLNPCKNFKYSSCKRRIKSRVDREAQTRNTERDVAERDVSNSLDSRSSVIGNGYDINQSECTSQDNVSSAESVCEITDLLPGINAESRGQDEVKENLDPIPLSTNSSHNSTNAVDRKSKYRVRSGVDHSMRSLNEKEGQKLISEKNETPKKVTAHDSQSLENQSKVLYNGWTDSSAYHEETNVQNVLEIATKNLLPRTFVNDNNAAAAAAAEYSDLIYISKRKRISANDENLGVTQNFVKITTAKEPTDCNNEENDKCLVKDARISESKSKLDDNVSRLRKIHVNSTTNNRTNESLSCKVSIDLARIQSILAAKLNNQSAEIVECNVRRQRVVNNFDSNDLSDSESVATLPKFQSFDNLTSDTEDDAIVELRRKSRSLENLCSLLPRSCVVMDNVAENRMQGCKRKRRSFEEHDCVR